MKHLDIARELLDQIKEGRYTVLPGLHELAARFNTSYVTVHHACRVLAEQGVIAGERGKRMRVTDAFARSHGLSPLPPEAEQRLYDTISRDVRDGTYRAGRRLPKREYFRLSHNVSPATIQQVFERLERDGLIHKRGKFRYAGAVKPSYVGTRRKHAAAANPVILILAAHDKEWYQFASSFHTMPFMTTFFNEIQRYSLTTRLVFAERLKNDYLNFNYLTLIEKVIKKLGNRFLGVLSICRPYYRASFEESLLLWTKRILRYGKPFVFLDYTDEGVSMNRDMFGGAQNYYRLHLDEREACRTVLEALHSHGHRKLGFPMYQEQRPAQHLWIAQREEALKAIIKRDFPSMELLARPQREPFWSMGVLPSEHEFLERLHHQARERGGLPRKTPRKPMKHLDLWGRSASFSELLRNRNATAIVAPNDHLALQYLFWFRAAGVDVPRDLSLVSFDNSLFSRGTSLSTLDFGMADLGYHAAQVFLAMVPTPSDRKGNLPGRCRFIDRGSIGQVPYGKER